VVTVQSKLTSKGQITLPKNMRDRLDLKTGDRVEFTIDDQTQSVALRKQAPRNSSQGILEHLSKDKPVAIEEMDKAIQARASRKHRA
jgi:AbrB family looped-hinge helix DNA binding protein